MLWIAKKINKKIKKKIAKDRAERYAEYVRQLSNKKLSKYGSLRIIAEGDSWFDYPLPWPAGNGVIKHLSNILGCPILNMAHYGDEVQQITGLSQRKEIISRLSDPQIRFDALLFSGGGNDLADEDKFCIWLKKDKLAEPEAMLDENAINAALALLEVEYKEIVTIRDQFSPETIIFVNSYDFPPITGKGVCGIGPWLKPSLDYVYQQLGVQPNPHTEYEVVKSLLTKFNLMLKRVESTSYKFVVVETQGTLNPVDADWQNEIHPSNAGFKKIADKFATAILEKFNITP